MESLVEQVRQEQDGQLRRTLIVKLVHVIKRRFFSGGKEPSLTGPQRPNPEAGDLSLGYTHLTATKSPGCASRTVSICPVAHGMTSSARHLAYSSEVTFSMALALASLGSTISRA